MSIRIRPSLCQPRHSIWFGSRALADMRFDRFGRMAMGPVFSHLITLSVSLNSPRLETQHGTNAKKAPLATEWRVARICESSQQLAVCCELVCRSAKTPGEPDVVIQCPSPLFPSLGTEAQSETVEILNGRAKTPNGGSPIQPIRIKRQRKRDLVPPRH